MKSWVISLILGIFIFSGCKKEPTTWNTENNLPLAHAVLTLNNLLPEYLVEDSTSLLRLKYEQELFSFNLDTLIQLPDTTISNAYGLPIPIDLMVPPNTFITTIPQNIAFNAGEVNLLETDILVGNLVMGITSSIEGDLEVEYKMPGATLNGVPFQQTFIVPAAPSQDYIVFTEEVSLAGYNFDLTGENNDTYNTLFAEMTIRTAHNNSEDIEVSGTDSIFITTSYTGIVPQYARGYFGNQVVEMDEPSIEIDTDHFLQDAIFEFQAASVDLLVTNGFGVDARLMLSGLYAETNNGETIEFEHNIIGNTININRATDNNGTVSPGIWSSSLNEQNSNVVDFINLVPSNLSFDGSVEINPLGNISNNNDFLYNFSELSGKLQVDLPLSLTLGNLILADTLPAKLDLQGHHDQLSEVLLLIYTINSYPMEISPVLGFHDQNGNILFKKVLEEKIPAAPLVEIHEDPIAVHRQFVLKIQGDELGSLLEMESISMEMNLNSAPEGIAVNLTGKMKLDIKIGADFIYKASID